VCGLVLAPAAAVAATGGFSSGSSSTALTATNTSTGLAVDATSAKGTALRSTSSGTGNGSALFLRQHATGSGSNGLYAKVYPSGGVHFGVWGVTSSSAIGTAGVRGQDASGAAAGVEGDGGFGVVGIGNTVGVLSEGSLGLDSGQISVTDDRVAGTCAISNGTGACTFTNAFLFGDTPAVVVTPQADPVGRYWVDTVSSTGFTIHDSSSVSITFNYVVIGLDPPAPAHASARRAAHTVPATGRRP
jgi:hypothetical protein